MHSDDLLDLIAAQLDVIDILDVLGWDTYDLVAVLRNEILARKEEFEDAVE